MRENRTSGLEGGAVQTNALSLPLLRMLRIGIIRSRRLFRSARGLPPLLKYPGLAPAVIYKIVALICVYSWFLFLLRLFLLFLAAVFFTAFLGHFLFLLLFRLVFTFASCLTGRQLFCA